jgi:hypothetical protein
MFSGKKDKPSGSMSTDSISVLSETMASIIIICSAKKVDIHGWFGFRRLPDPDQQSSFEYKSICMLGLRKTIQKPFHGIILNKFMKWSKIGL